MSSPQYANVAQAKHETDSDGSFRSLSGDDDGGNGSDTNIDISEQEHDVADSGDDNTISCDLEKCSEAEMNTCGMYHGIVRALCCCVCVTVTV